MQNRLCQEKEQRTQQFGLRSPSQSACKELSRRTGVAAKDWHSELRRRAFDKLNRFSDNQLVEYI